MKISPEICELEQTSLSLTLCTLRLKISKGHCSFSAVRLRFKASILPEVVAPSLRADK